MKSISLPKSDTPPDVSEIVRRISNSLDITALRATANAAVTAANATYASVRAARVTAGLSVSDPVVYAPSARAVDGLIVAAVVNMLGEVPLNFTRS